MDILEKNNQNFTSDFVIDILVNNLAIDNSVSMVEFLIYNMSK